VPESADAPQWRAGEHEVTRWCRMLAEYGIPADPGELCLSAPPGEAPACAHGATVIHPGAASAARRWPAERFGAVARAERAAGRDVVITGGTPETALANEVARLGEVPKGRVLAGHTDLAGLARTIAVAGRVVCGDTGVAHLATALHTPSVVLFGPVSPAVWGPPPEPRHRVLWSGSQGDPHADSVDHGLLEIGVADVLAQLRRLEPARRRALLAQGAPKSCT
jgi:ADP-heptose:LPS heptosyltransferase